MLNIGTDILIWQVASCASHCKKIFLFGCHHFVCQKYMFPKAKLSSTTWQRRGGGVCVCALVYRKAHRKCIVGQPRNNTADCFPLTKKVWFLIVKRGRFTACGFKRLETEAILRESAAHWADSRNVIGIIQLYKEKKNPKIGNQRGWVGNHLH